MRIKLISDTHFEFQIDQGRSFVESLDCTDVDLLIVAGDLTNQKTGIVQSIGMLCKKFPRVVYVAGNHEYYGSGLGPVNIAMAKACNIYNNLSVLEKDIVKIDGHRILGTTMWFPETYDAVGYSNGWSDFECISNFRDWVFEKNKKAVAFLKKEMRKGDIVVTHYLPSFKSVHPRYKDEVSNCYFVCDMEELILERKPAFWFHGHTHESMDYRIGETRVVCNPFGYYPSMININFSNLIIDI